MGFSGLRLELRAEENQEESVTCDGVGHDLKEEREEFSFHGFRLEERGERVKEKINLFLRESGKVRIHWGKRRKTKEGKGEQGEEGKPIPCRIP